MGSRDAERLNYTLFGLLFLVPATADPGHDDPGRRDGGRAHGRLQRLDMRLPLLPLVAYGVVGWHAVEEARLASDGWQAFA